MCFGPTSALALSADSPICKDNHRVICIVDGDTLCFQRIKFWLKDIDTPEKAPRKD